jgi:D-lactate dehydrogenase (cytochrome)
VTFGHQATAEDVERSGVVGPIFGHAGDGNFHCILVVHPGLDDPAYTAAVEGVNERLIRATLAAGGTCTGEHGIGNGKKKYLEAQYGAATLDVMRGIKRSMDPLGIMNPGKIFDM